MARNKIDACMVCYPDDCTCFAPKKAQKRPPVQEKSVAPAQPTDAGPPVREDVKARMKAAAAAAPPPPPPPAPRVAPRPPVKSEEDILFYAAIRSLGPIMHPEEREKWGMVISSAPTQDEKFIEWKARRAWHLAQ